MNKNGQTLIMADLLNFTVGMWTIFSVFENEYQTFTFLDFLNSQHPNFNFTIKKEHMKQLPFLDVLNTLSHRVITSLYRKSKFTGHFDRSTIVLYHLHKRKVSLKL